VELRAVRSWTEAHLDRIKELFGLRAWRIEIRYEKSPPEGEQDTLAQVTALSERERALVVLYCDPIRDEAELEHTLEHEMLHILIAPFEEAFEVAQPMLPAGKARDSVAVAYMQAAERAVRNLERLLEGIRRAKRG